MYIILLRFGENKSAAPELMDGHNAWIAKGFEDGVFRCVGSLDVGDGAIIAHGEDLDVMKNRVQDDPFVEHNVVSAQVHQVDLKRAKDELKHLI